jgi:hypothetical protein
VLDDFKIVFDGLGKLLNVDERVRRQHDGIALLHSFASAQAVTYLPEPGPTYGTHTGFDMRQPEVDWALQPGGLNHLSWHRAIRALGLQFEYVSDRMLRLGEFRPEQYKVLILSQCEALGSAEAEVIRAFVKNGGTLLADVRPGLYDGHCKPLAAGMLDDVFGVRHSGNVAATSGPGQIAGDLAGREIAVRLPNLYVNPALELAGGRALGGVGATPICIVNPYGKGQAILLNFTMNSFPNLSLPETPEAAADVLDAVFAAAGVVWPLRLLDEQGQRLRNVEAVRWKTGDHLEVLALAFPLDDGAHREPALREHYRGNGSWISRDAATPLRLVLPRATSITQIGTGRSTRSRKDFTVLLRPRLPVEVEQRPVFIVLSDRRLRSPVVEPLSRRAVPGESVSLKLTIPDAQGLHALKLRVTAPDGRPAGWFDQTVIVGEQGAEITLPLAHNEQAGKWTVEATDLYTDKAGVCTFRVAE